MAQNCPPARPASTVGLPQEGYREGPQQLLSSVIQLRAAVRTVVASRLPALLALLRYFLFARRSSALSQLFFKGTQADFAVPALGFAVKFQRCAPVGTIDRPQPPYLVLLFSILRLKGSIFAPALGTNRTVLPDHPHCGQTEPDGFRVFHIPCRIFRCCGSTAAHPRGWVRLGLFPLRLQNLPVLRSQTAHPAIRLAVYRSGLRLQILLHLVCTAGCCHKASALLPTPYSYS